MIVTHVIKNEKKQKTRQAKKLNLNYEYKLQLCNKRLAPLLHMSWLSASVVSMHAWRNNIRKIVNFNKRSFLFFVFWLQQQPQSFVARRLEKINNNNGKLFREVIWFVHCVVVVVIEKLIKF